MGNQKSKARSDGGPRVNKRHKCDFATRRLDEIHRKSNRNPGQPTPEVPSSVKTAELHGELSASMRDSAKRKVVPCWHAKKGR